MLRDYFRKKLLSFYYGRRRNAPGVIKYYDLYKSHEKWSRDQLLDYQLKELKKMLIHAYEQTRYYRRLFDECGFDAYGFKSIEQLEQIPILTKEIIRENMPELQAGNINEHEKHKTRTGGTSGPMMEFYRDNICRGHRVAIQWRFDSWAGWDLGTNVAHIWPALQDFAPKFGFKGKLVSKYLTGDYMFYGGHIDNNTAQKMAKEIIKINPRLIRCFPTPACLFLKNLDSSKLDHPRISGVVSTGEPLYPHQRSVLEKGFGCPVFDIYGSRETGMTAGECSTHENLHIAIDSVVMEIVKDGKQLSPGRDGEIVLTDFINYAMPLIRYRIGDYGRVLRGACPCGMGFPLMKNLPGRISDNFYDIEGNVVSPISLLANIVLTGPRVGQVQLVQNNPREIVVRITKNPTPDDTIKEYYNSNIKKAIKGLETVKFEIVDKIESEKSGKHRFAICNIDPSALKRLKDRKNHN